MQTSQDKPKEISKESMSNQGEGHVEPGKKGLSVSDHPITPAEARELQSDEAKKHGGVVPKDSVAALAESAAARNVNAGIVPP